MKCIFSIDVEDWFHILDLPNAPKLEQWDAMPSRVEANFLKLLSILDDCRCKATCFFLGWVAERYPHLVREAVREGHEIASHGYAHKLAYEMTSRKFFDDALRSKRLIEDICGHPVSGYRASGFSLTKDTPWFFDRLVEAGYRYDSSLFPARRGHGGLANGRYAPYRLEATNFVEFPATVEELLGEPMCFFGGGYLRLFPYPVIKKMTQRVLRQRRPAIFYIHPREIDSKCPRLAMGIRRSFKSYVNVSKTEAKIRRLLNDFEAGTFQDYLNSQEPILPADADWSMSQTLAKDRLGLSRV